MKFRTVALISIFASSAFCYDDVGQIHRQQQEQLQADLLAEQTRAMQRQADAMERANEIQRQQIRDAQQRQDDAEAARNAERRRLQQQEAARRNSEAAMAARQSERAAALILAEQERARKAIELEYAKARLAEERRQLLASVTPATPESGDIFSVRQTPKYKQEEAESHNRASKKYPALFAEGTPEGLGFRKFINECWEDEYRKRDYFFSAAWPETLAGIFMARLSAAPPAPLAPAVINPVVSTAQPESQFDADLQRNTRRLYDLVPELADKSSALRKDFDLYLQAYSADPFSDQTIFDHGDWPGVMWNKYVVQKRENPKAILDR